MPIEKATQERSHDLFFSHAKNKFFSKTFKISAPNSFFPKNDKILLGNGGIFQQVHGLEMKICAKEARNLKSKIEFRRLMEKMKKRFLGLPGAVRSLRIFEEVVDLVRRICKVGKGAQVENLLLILIGSFAQASTLGVFFKQIRFRLGIHQPFEDSSV